MDAKTSVGNVVSAGEGSPSGSPSTAGQTCENPPPGAAEGGGTAQGAAENARGHEVIFTEEERAYLGACVNETLQKLDECYDDIGFRDIARSELNILVSHVIASSAASSARTQAANLQSDLTASYQRAASLQAGALMRIGGAVERIANAVDAARDFLSELVTEPPGDNAPSKAVQS